MRVGIVRVPSAFLMEKDLKSPADQIFMGWAVGILGEEGEYYQIVTHYGYPGYVKRDAVKITIEEKLRQRDRCGRQMMVAAPFADVLAETKVQGDRLVTLDKGSYVECITYSGKGEDVRGKTYEGYLRVRRSEERRVGKECRL